MLVPRITEYWEGVGFSLCMWRGTHFSSGIQGDAEISPLRWRPSFYLCAHTWRPDEAMGCPFLSLTVPLTSLRQFISEYVANGFLLG